MIAARGAARVVAGAAAVLAGGVAAAQVPADGGADMALIAACAEAPIGGPDCDRGALAESLGLLQAGDVAPFRALGMESFAMLTALRYGASALWYADTGEGCYAEEERSAAISIWREWVALPADAPAETKDMFAMYDRLIRAVATMEMPC